MFTAGGLVTERALSRVVLVFQLFGRWCTILLFRGVLCYWWTRKPPLRWYCSGLSLRHTGDLDVGLVVILFCHNDIRGCSIGGISMVVTENVQIFGITATQNSIYLLHWLGGIIFWTNFRTYITFHGWLGFHRKYTRHNIFSSEKKKLSSLASQKPILATRETYIDSGM